MDKRLFTFGVFIDLKKAFDTVNHDILLHKLQFYGFSGILHDWFKSYLSEWTQTIPEVKFQRNVSRSVAYLGAPFLLYIDDIHNCSDKFRFFLFVDDTNILYSDKNLKSLESTDAELKKLYI